ncbi:hypothetical protein WJX74_008884 [Apatococcus lobatus]|uniref:Protein EARLY FLOWERING 4 domain-containing protein n=1 Tax=Apatococcus lobatus TaxID=904363 RepID=A0AAW1RHJ6_9CHLO
MNAATEPADVSGGAEQDPASDSAVAWPGYEKFGTVQDILDQNKILINEINANHEAQNPQGLARNVILIRELNSNISKVVDHYKDLSASFQEFSPEEDMEPAAPKEE